MAEPLRDRILEAVVERLSGLTGAAFGGYPSPPVVTRRWRPLEAVNEFPTVIVTPGSGSTLREIGITGHFELRFRARVYGYVRSDDAAPASRWLLRLQEDVIDTLLAEPTLGGLSREIQILEDETDDGQAEPKAEFWQDVLVIADEIKALS
jgi:hypothetical protein